MPDCFPAVAEDIAFELLILHAVADRGRSLTGTRAAALRTSYIWEAPPAERRSFGARKAMIHLASALVIASTLGITPPASLPALAQRNEVRITVVDAQTSKPLANVVLRDAHGSTIARTGSDGKLTFSPAAGSPSYSLESAGYQTIHLTRAQLGGSNLISMRKAAPQAGPSPRPTVKPTARPVPAATPKAKATAKPVAKPAATPVATPRPVKRAKPATPKPVQRPRAATRLEPPTKAPVLTPSKGRRYVVKPGDTLWDIAHQTMGNPSSWPSLFEANRTRIARPAMIYPGQTLVIPASASTPPRYRGTHTVSRGESLWQIAETVYGNPLRWKALYQANRGIIKRPSLIYPGQTLLLPR